MTSGFGGSRARLGFRIILIVTCSLTFPTGRWVSRRIEGQSPGLSYEITCAGAWDHRALRPEKGMAWDLE
jgi:hypothetical protein